MFKEKKGFVYPADTFKEFECFMSGELVTIVAESNSGKTTFAMDIIQKNAEIGRKGYYINLEFPIETMRQSRWLWLNGKTKKNLTDLAPLTDEEKKSMNLYVEQQLKKFDYYNEPKGISLERLTQIIEVAALSGYDLIVVDTFSRIHGNLESDKARTNQNKCMEVFQEMAQRLGIAIILLHHTNRQGTFEGSQKIMDLSNVFILIEKDFADGTQEEYRRYTLTKDKFVSVKQVELFYHGGKYEY